MRVSLSLDLTDAELRTLGIYLSGKNRNATRAEIKAFVAAAIKKRLAYPEGMQTTLKTEICPKCSKPIAIAVPMGIEAAAPSKAKPAKAVPQPAAGLSKADLRAITKGLDALAAAGASARLIESNLRKHFKVAKK